MNHPPSTIQPPLNLEVLLSDKSISSKDTLLPFVGQPI